MKAIQKICVPLLAYLISASLSPGSAQPANPAIYGALPTVSEAAISPDGNAIAQIQSVNGIQSVAIYDLTGASNPVGIEIGNVKARDLFWANDKYVVFLISASRTYNYGEGNRTAEVWRWVSTDRKAKSKTFLFRSFYRDRYYYGSGQIMSTLPNDPDSLLLGHYYSGFSLFKVGLDKEREELISRGETPRYFSEDRRTVDWVVTKNGEPVVRVDYLTRGEVREFLLRDSNSERWKTISAIPEGREEDSKVNVIAPAGPDTLVYATSSHEGRSGLYTFDVNSGKFTTPTVTLPDYDLYSVVKDHISGEVVGARYVDDMMQTIFFDADLKSAQTAIEAALPNASPVIESWSSDKTKFLIRVKYSDHPDQVFLFDKPARKLSMVTPTYQALDGKVAAKKEPFNYVASDGMNIPGYLTAPVDGSKINMPLVVLPHGGPWARDDQSFDWWSFFYAARGYLVYQPNFRGSTGYGKAYKEAGNGEWGRKMQNDITEGVQKLIADGRVDPNRVCIVGASYGGYAALAGATLTPDLYACVVSVNGISNLNQLLADAGGRDGDDDYWTKRIGSRFSNDDEMRAVSPLYNIDAVRAPILLIHSEDDIVVPEGQSRRMRNALRESGKAHEFVILDGEDHWLSSGETRTEMLSLSIDFIDQHIGQ